VRTALPFIARLLCHRDWNHPGGEYVRKKLNTRVYVSCLYDLVLPILAQTTSVTYQGKLTDGGNPANGKYDFVFRLFDSSGTQIGGDLEKGDVPVTGGR
jgi:hypothetical protein